jgi:Ser/Thr protein kinase RdoA (MazF antagonist)
LSENRRADDRESPLPGGTANIGQVTRRGGTVRRPTGSYTPAVHALLGHLAQNGFDGCPRVVGVEGRTEVLTYLPGDAAFQPGRPGTMLLPDWAQTDAAMVSVARLLRRFHDASTSFDPTGWPWQRSVPDGWAGTRVTHNDTHPANLIFADGVAVGLIDFDLAGPGTVAFELAVAACFWIPIREDRDVTDARRGRMYERFRLFLDGYGAAEDVREDVVRALVPANDWIFGIIRENAERGHPAFKRMWALRADIATRALSFAETRNAELRAAVL